VQLAKKDIERAPGSISISLNIVDTKNNPSEAVKALNQALALAKPDLVISALSSVSKAIVPIVDEHGIPTAVTTTAMTGLPNDTQTVFRVYPTSRNFVAPVAQFMAKNHKKIAVLYVEDDFGNSNYQVFSELAQADGMEIVDHQSYTLTQEDVRSTVSRVLSSSPEAVFVTGYGPAFTRVFLALRELSPTTPVYTEIGFANPAVLDALGDAANDIVFDGTEIELEGPQSEIARRFKDEYVSAYGKTPYQVAGFAYDVLQLTVKARTSNGGVFTKQRIVSMTPYEGVMGELRLDKQGECDIALRLMRREAGKNVLVK
jgi:branched-chain amino acid transport system substrate-binding protein